MDFVHGQVANGLAFRVLTVDDNWSRESVLLETGFRLTSREIIMALDQAAQSRKLPASINVDHATRFPSLVMDDWAHVNHGVWHLQDLESQQIMDFVNFFRSTQR